MRLGFLAKKKGRKKMKSGFDKSVAKYAIISKISMGIQRGNARCLDAA
jgi:hypothetical protein